jgi:hypothetical protein
MLDTLPIVDLALSGESDGAWLNQISDCLARWTNAALQTPEVCP